MNILISCSVHWPDNKLFAKVLKIRIIFNLFHLAGAVCHSKLIILNILHCCFWDRESYAFIFQINVLYNVVDDAQNEHGVQKLFFFFIMFFIKLKAIWLTISMFFINVLQMYYFKSCRFHKYEFNLYVKHVHLIYCYILNYILICHLTTFVISLECYLCVEVLSGSKIFEIHWKCLTSYQSGCFKVSEEEEAGVLVVGCCCKFCYMSL